MKIRSTINRNYLFLEARRKRRVVAAIVMVVACAIMAGVAIETRESKISNATTRPGKEIVIACSHDLRASHVIAKPTIIVGMRDQFGRRYKTTQQTA